MNERGSQESHPSGLESLPSDVGSAVFALPPCVSPLDDPAVIFLDGVWGFRLGPLAFADDSDGIAIPCAGDAQPVGIISFIGVDQQECDRQTQQHRHHLFAFIAVGGGGFNRQWARVAVA